MSQKKELLQVRYWNLRYLNHSKRPLNRLCESLTFKGKSPEVFREELYPRERHKNKLWIQLERLLKEFKIRLFWLIFLSNLDRFRILKLIRVIVNFSNKILIKIMICTKISLCNQWIKKKINTWKFTLLISSLLLILKTTSTSKTLKNKMKRYIYHNSRSWVSKRIKR